MLLLVHFFFSWCDGKGGFFAVVCWWRKSMVLCDMSPVPSVLFCRAWLLDIHTYRRTLKAHILLPPHALISHGMIFQRAQRSCCLSARMMYHDELALCKHQDDAPARYERQSTSTYLQSACSHTHTHTHTPPSSGAGIERQISKTCSYTCAHRRIPTKLRTNVHTENSLFEAGETNFKNLHVCVHTHTCIYT